ncbi:MAG: hypothetical protein JO000_08920 [Alphaproteobacteria bacterium]|nr:hypothetical protein [Alphaproteobacteria bacterium]
MRTVAEYLSKAAEFDALADAADGALRKRYADLADGYRLLARERKRLAAEGVLRPDDALLENRDCGSERRGA